MNSRALISIALTIYTITGCSEKMTNKTGSIASEPQAVPSITTLKKISRVGPCRISVSKQLFRRDLTPRVVENLEDRNPPPLSASIQLEFDNTGGVITRLSWESFVWNDESKTYLPIEMQDMYGNPPWTGQIAAGEKKSVQLISHTGPPLEVRNKTAIVFRFTDQKGNVTWIRTDFSPIAVTN